jgi:DNA-binding response OmpR family regulator
VIIEADRTARHQLSQLLRRHGYGVVAVSRLDDAVDSTLAASPHLVLLDIDRPDWGGFQLCRRLRQRSKVPIIVLSDRDDEADQLMCLHLGADCCLVKSHRPSVLLAQIATLLSRAYETAAPNLVRCDDLVVDLARSRVSRGRRGVELTKNELRVMSLLAQRPGAIVSRQEIMEALWQTDTYVSDNTITVCVNRLRKKLSRIGAGQALQTRRGQGYSLDLRSDRSDAGPPAPASAINRSGPGQNGPPPTF